MIQLNFRFKYQKLKIIKTIILILIIFLADAARKYVKKSEQAIYF
ncbi:hypothetical protein VRK_08710 [Vibrio sp. MEBiC08052]|nr:hypothetical protein VRK_08710 [Vibrio sp. MEBiC08052]